MKGNEKIVDLGIFGIENLEDFERIVRVEPEVSKLTIQCLTAAKIDIIARNLPELQTLQFQVCKIQMISQYENRCGIVIKYFRFDFFFSPQYQSVEK